MTLPFSNKNLFAIKFFNFSQIKQQEQLKHKY